MSTPLNPEAIAEAGRKLVTDSHWSVLSLRSVAAALDVTPMALYRHVANREALSSLVLESIVEGCPHVASSGNAAADLTNWARAFHTGLAEFPGVAGWLLTHWFDSPAMLERIEGLLALVTTHSLDGFDAVATTNAVFTYVLMRCEAEQQVRSAGVVKRNLRLASATHPLPHLTALASHYTTAEFDAHFEFGLHALVRGMNLPKGKKR